MKKIKEWESEPSQLEYLIKGYRAVILRNEMLALCGYIAIPKGHPIYGVETPNIRCHGGLTYSQMGLRIIDPLGLDYWIGFDCGHVYDLIPRMDSEREIGYSFGQIITYKNIDYVKAEICKVVDRLEELRGENNG